MIPPLTLLLTGVALSLKVRQGTKGIFCLTEIFEVRHGGSWKRLTYWEKTKRKKILNFSMREWSTPSFLSVTCCIRWVQDWWGQLGGLHSCPQQTVLIYRSDLRNLTRWTYYLVLRISIDKAYPQIPAVSGNLSSELSSSTSPWLPVVKDLSLAHCPHRPVLRKLS